jgi:hypothetical protein
VLTATHANCTTGAPVWTYSSITGLIARNAPCS